MPADIGGNGFVGVAFETVPGTYVAPAFYVPIMSESLKFVQETIYRRPIRQSVDIVGAITGFAHTEGDIVMEAFEDAMAYFFHAGRYSVAKTGAGPDYTYTYTPT